LRSYAAELVLSAFGTVEIPEAHDQSPDVAMAINREAIKREPQAPLGMLPYRVGDTKVLGTNIN
jgi:hypothetical protein